MLDNKYKKIIDKHKKVAVAVSGGADSMALALLLNEQTNSKLIAITVDHGLREESAREAKQVKKWLEKYDIEHHILKWEGDKKNSNIQFEARTARYQLMCDFCKKNDIQLLLVAHNLQDNAETLLMRIMRGSGVDGLSAIADATKINNIEVLRPLLMFVGAL